MIADQIGHASTAMIDKVYGATSRQNLAHLGRVANDIVRSRLRERPKPLVKEKEPAEEVPVLPVVPARYAGFFGENLKALRANAGMTQKELAGRLGMERQQVCDMERDYNRPTVEVVVRLAEIFGVDTRYFGQVGKDGEK